MHRIVFILVIVFLIVLFIGCLDMQIHTRPRASSFIPREVNVDVIPEDPDEVLAVQYPPGGGGDGWMVVVIDADNVAVANHATTSDR